MRDKTEAGSRNLLHYKNSGVILPRPLGKHIGYPHRIKYSLPGLQNFNKRRDIRKRHFTVLVDICFWEKHASL